MTTKLAPGGDVNTFIATITTSATSLARHSCKLPDQLLSVLLLLALHEDAQPWARSVLAGATSLTFSDTRAKVRNYYLADTARRQSGTPGDERPPLAAFGAEEKKGKFCYGCKKAGYTKADCPNPKCVAARQRRAEVKGKTEDQNQKGLREVAMSAYAKSIVELNLANKLRHAKQSRPHMLQVLYFKRSTLPRRHHPGCMSW